MSLYARVARALARRAGLRVFRFFGRPLDTTVPATVPAGLALRVLSEPQVLELCGQPELDLQPGAVSAAYARGDLCVAAFDASAAVGYCWIAFAPLPHLDGVWVSFHRRVAWTYKSLVRPSHRGRGIAPALYRFADSDCRERGRRDSVICVESHNRPSVSAALRTGYAPAGYGSYLLRGARVVAWCSPAAEGAGVLFFLPKPMGSVCRAS